jgi:hypothetical protein
MDKMVHRADTAVEDTKLTEWEKMTKSRKNLNELNFILTKREI